MRSGVERDDRAEVCVSSRWPTNSFRDLQLRKLPLLLLRIPDDQVIERLVALVDLGLLRLPLAAEDHDLPSPSDCRVEVARQRTGFREIRLLRPKLLPEERSKVQVPERVQKARRFYCAPTEDVDCVRDERYGSSDLVQVDRVSEAREGRGGNTRVVAASRP